MAIKHLFSELTNPHSSLVFSIKVQVWLRQNICTLSFLSTHKFIFIFSMEKILSSFDHISERVHKILGSFYSLKCLLIRAPSMELWLCSAVLRTSLLGSFVLLPLLPVDYSEWTWMWTSTWTWTWIQMWRRTWIQTWAWAWKWTWTWARTWTSVGTGTVFFCVHQYKPLLSGNCCSVNSISGNSCVWLLSGERRKRAAKRWQKWKFAE